VDDPKTNKPKKKEVSSTFVMSSYLKRTGSLFIKGKEQL
jgi:hypothetical protein